MGVCTESVALDTTVLGVTLAMTDDSGGTRDDSGVTRDDSGGGGKVEDIFGVVVSPVRWSV